MNTLIRDAKWSLFVIGMSAFIFISLGVLRDYVGRRAHDGALEKRCPHTKIVAKSCYDADGTIEIMYPGQTAEIEIELHVAPDLTRAPSWQ